MPQLRDGKASLRVAHAVNPRFPKLSDSQLDALLRAAAKTAELHFGVQVSYEGKATEISLQQLLHGIPQPFAEHHLALIEAARKGPIDRGQLAKAYQDTISLNPAPTQDVIAYARRLEGSLQARDVRELATFLADRHADRIQLLRSSVATDGRPLVDDQPYNEILFWDVVGRGDLPFDVIVTNQPILSLEYSTPDVHTGLRGGISVGMTFYSRSGRYGGAIVWSTFPFTSEIPPFVELRGGQTYPVDEAVSLAGIAMAHEYGHLLFQFGHPFGNAACIMHPTPLLRFREQVAALEAKSCPIGTSAAMKPGAIPMQYHE